MTSAVAAGCWVAVCGPDGASLRALAEVEHRLLDLGVALGGTAWMATHVVRSPEGGHYAGSLTTGDGEAAAAALSTAVADGYGWAVVDDGGVGSCGGEGDHRAHAVLAATAHRDRTEGRLVRFPGQEELPDRLPLADLVPTSVVDEVVSWVSPTTRRWCCARTASCGRSWRPGGCACW